MRISLISSRRAIVPLVAGAALFTVSSAVVTVQSKADPVVRTIIADGSTTDQDLFNAYAAGLNGTDNTLGAWYAPGVGSPEALVASYDATGDSPIQPIPGGDSYTRPNGSGAGRDALYDAWTSMACGGFSGLQPPDVTIARTSSVGPAVPFGDLADPQFDLVPLARDAVGVAIYDEPGITNLTTEELQAIFGAPAFSDGVYQSGASGDTWSIGDIYRDTTNDDADPVYVTQNTDSDSVASSTGIPLNPILPQASSGTRQFWLTALGFTSNDDTAPWVTNGDGSNTGIEENDLGVVSGGGDGTIVPFSGAQAIAQNDGTSPSTGSFANIGFPTINGSTLYTDEGGGVWEPGTLTGGNGGDATVDSTSAPQYQVGQFRRDVYSEIATSNDNPYAGQSIDTVVRTDLPTVQDSKGEPLVLDFGFAPLKLSGANAYTTAQDYVTSTCG